MARNRTPAKISTQVYTDPAIKETCTQLNVDGNLRGPGGEGGGGWEVEVKGQGREKWGGRGAGACISEIGWMDRGGLGGMRRGI